VSIFRAIAAAADADPNAQFNHLQASINHVSENQVQLGHAVKAIQNKDRLRDCKDWEENEGRLNCDMLNRFIVIGGPYFDPGPNLQQNLQDQVAIIKLLIFVVIVSSAKLIPYSPLPYVFVRTVDSSVERWA
jgi:hypothetical protein